MAAALRGIAAHIVVPENANALKLRNIVEAGATVAVFGLGAVGLSVIHGARMANAGRIIAIDINPTKFDFACQLGIWLFWFG